MSDVNAETNLIEDMYNFFSISQIGGMGGLMYHNLQMGPGNTQLAKQAIYDPFVASATGGPQNLALTAWYNYSQTPNLVMSFNVSCTSTDYLVNFNFYITDPGTGTSTAVYSGSVQSGVPDNQADYVTSFAVNTTNLTAGTYWISMDATAAYIGPPPPPGPGLSANTVSNAVDTDGVGAGLVRNSANPANFDEFTPLGLYRAVFGNVGTPATGIYGNKRTSFDVVFA